MCQDGEATINTVSYEDFKKFITGNLPLLLQMQAYSRQSVTPPVSQFSTNVVIYSTESTTYTHDKP